MAAQWCRHLQTHSWKCSKGKARHFKWLVFFSSYLRTWTWTWTCHRWWGMVHRHCWSAEPSPSNGNLETIKPEMERSAYMIKSLARWLNAVLVSLKHFQHKVPRGHKTNILQWIGKSLIVNFTLCRGPKEMPFSSLSHKNSHKKYKWSLGDYATTQTTIDSGW